MQFSIARLLLITLFVNFVVAATFVFPPTIGISILTFVALFVVPPFIIVGAFNTRGLRQSFFLGAMISGTAHFVINVYLAVMILASASQGGLSDFDDLGESWIQYLNGIGFLFGAIGGFSGMATYYFLKLGDKQKAQQLPIDQKSMHSTPPEIYPEQSDLLLAEQADPSIPR